MLCGGSERQLLCVRTAWLPRRNFSKYFGAAKSSGGSFHFQGPALRPCVEKQRSIHCTSISSSSTCDQTACALGMRALILNINASRRLTVGNPASILSCVHPSIRRFQHGSLRHGSSYASFRCTPLRLKPIQQRFYHASISNLDEPTIYALSTASGRAAIAVIRISGSACRQVLISVALLSTLSSPALDISSALPNGRIPQASPGKSA